MTSSDYSEYIVENLDKNISYSEYIAENLSKIHTSGSIGTSGYSDVTDKVNKAMIILKINENYDYILECKEWKYIIKLINKNNKQIHTIKIDNDLEGNLLEKILISIKKYFRDTNLKKLV